MQTISREIAAKLLLESDENHFLTVEFVKKNGSLRRMTCRKNVRKHLHGGSLRYDPIEKGLLPVFDVENNDYRMICLNSIRTITMEGNKFKVE